MPITAINKTKNPDLVNGSSVDLANAPLQRKVCIVSLFSGAGGLEIAACKTGKVEAIVSTDSNATFLSTVDKNMPTHFPRVRHASIVADAKELKGATLRKLLGSTPDIVMGGPPCDDYTQFGKRRGHDGEKGPLIFQFLRVVDELKPACFIFENVPNLARQFKDVFHVFVKRSQEIGYFTQWSILKACEYGAPTLRTRIFVIGWRDERLNAAFRFPDATHANPETFPFLSTLGAPLKPFIFVSDVLDGLPDLGMPNSETLLNHEGRKHRPETIEHFKMIPPGKKSVKSFRYRAPWRGLIQSLTAGRDDSTKAYLHPIHHREMTVREYSRLHIFPNSWNFSGTVNNGVKQVANSVPVPLGQAVIEETIKTLSIDQSIPRS
jgi:DNA (cytosine-5)-methyltransferase 1